MCDKWHGLVGTTDHQGPYLPLGAAACSLPLTINSNDITGLILEMNGPIPPNHKPSHAIFLSLSLVSNFFIIKEAEGE